MPVQISIVGGSVAGLLAAEEIGKQGLVASVYEEHREIGVPEKCDGLVSSKGLSELGIVPPSNVVQNRLTKAVFFSPSGREISIGADRQNVVVLDRSRFDKFLAERAAKEGAEIHVGKRVVKYSQDADIVNLKFDSGEVETKFLLDCSGYESYIRSGGGTLQGGQYLVYGRWFEKSTVEVYVDPGMAPGFFYWVIPISNDMAKIGIAGSGVNTFESLDEFAKRKGGVPIRKMAAPVVCRGALGSFVEGRIARAGDAAGQAKPTTGGGIYTGGYGGKLAGRAAANALRKDQPEKLKEYEDNWRTIFGSEFRLQLYARNIFSKMSKDQIDRLFQMIETSDVPMKISNEGDFDMHSISIAKALGVSKTVATMGIVISNELKSLLS